MLATITSESSSKQFPGHSRVIHEPFAANWAVTYLESAYNPVRTESQGYLKI